MAVVVGEEAHRNGHTDVDTRACTNPSDASGRDEAQPSATQTTLCGMYACIMRTKGILAPLQGGKRHKYLAQSNQSIASSLLMKFNRGV